MAKKENKKIQGPAGAAPAIVIHNIETRPVNRTTQDIPKWRQAIQSAESRTPRRTLLYDLYADVVQDGHVMAVKGKRIDAATTANWQFVDKDGKPVDEVNDIIDSTGFDDMITEIMESKFWGYSIMEPTFWKDHDEKWEMAANLLPRLNYRPEKGIVAYQATGDDGVNIREGIYTKTIMEVGKPSDLGLLVSAAQYAILKRGGIGDWAMFVQVFGRPVVDATWDGFDEAQRIKLQKSLDIGPGGVIIRPEGTAVTLLDGAKGQSNTHGDFYKAMNKEISKALLGTTETTESSDSSGYAQAETHGEQDDNKHDSDLSFVRKVLNSRFKRVLEAAGFKTQGGRFVIQGDEVRLKKDQAFEIHRSMVMDINLPLDHDFFYEEYGLPKPENYDQIIKEREALKNVVEKDGRPKTDEGSGKDNEDVDKKSKKDKIELSWYEKLFTKLFPTAPAVTTGATNGHPHTIDLAFADDFDNDALIQRIFDEKGTLMFDKSIYEYTVKKLLKAFKTGFSKDFVGLQFAPGFSYDVDDPGLIAAFEQNLFQFAGAKTLAQLTELNRLFRSGIGFNRFYEEAQKIMGKYNRDWLLTEYNTAILVAQSTATYNRLYAQKDVFPYWLYKTAGDELVRHSHTLLEGLILRADDERWKKIYPPNGFNCRCYVVPRQDWEVKDVDHEAMSAQADAYLDSPAFERENGRGWGMNKSELGIVFTPNQQYKHPTPGETEKQLNSLEPKHYELPPAEFATKEGTEALPDFDENVTEWLDALETIKNVKVLRDWQKRPINIDTTNFNRTIATQADKGKLIAALNETLSSPDEVWINGSNLDDMVYIKYYKGETFIAIGKVQPGQVVLDNWMKVENVKEALANYRKGLLMFSNHSKTINLKYDPDQPRVEKGSPYGGQWTKLGVVSFSDKELYRGDTRCKGNILKENPDYISEKGVKNKAGYYFFTDNKDEAKSYANESGNINIRENHRQPNITTIKASADKFLDLSNDNAHEVFRVLENNLFGGSLGFDDFLVLRGQEKGLQNIANENMRKISLESYKSTYNDYKNNTGKGTYQKFGAVSLSNFDLGVHFKKLLEENSFSGYIFKDTSSNFNTKHYAFTNSRNLNITNKEGNCPE